MFDAGCSIVSTSRDAGGMSYSPFVQSAGVQSGTFFICNDSYCRSGYGKVSSIASITDIAFSNIFMIPEHLLSMHPFVRQLHMETSREVLLAGEARETTDREDAIETEDVTMFEDTGIG